MAKKERNQRAGSGVPIFMNNKLKYSRNDGLYDGNGEIKVCALELYAGQDKILIVLCYRWSYIKIESRVWKKFFVQMKGKFLIDGDCNAHHHALDRKSVLQ